MKMLEYHLNESVDLSSRNKDFIDNSVKWIVSHFNINENSKIIDFGCGPGLYTTQFAEKSAKTSGIDFSERSIHHAKNIAASKSLDINYFYQNYLEFETNEKYDLITMIFCDFCALTDITGNKLRLTRQGFFCKITVYIKYSFLNYRHKIQLISKKSRGKSYY